MKQHAASQSISLPFILTWQAVVSLTFLFTGSIALGLPPGSLGPLEAAWLGLLFLAYAASALPLTLCLSGQWAVGLFPVVIVPSRRLRSPG